MKKAVTFPNNIATPNRSEMRIANCASRISRDSRGDAWPSIFRLDTPASS
jgi:hypothetical protein